MRNNFEVSMIMTIDHRHQLSQPSEANVVEGVKVNVVEEVEAKVVIQMKEALQQFPSWEENR